MSEKIEHLTRKMLLYVLEIAASKAEFRRYLGNALSELEDREMWVFSAILQKYLIDIKYKKSLDDFDAVGSAVSDFDNSLVVCDSAPLQNKFEEHKQMKQPNLRDFWPDSFCEVVEDNLAKLEDLDVPEDVKEEIAFLEAWDTESSLVLPVEKMIEEDPNQSALKPELMNFFKNHPGEFERLIEKDFDGTLTAEDVRPQIHRLLNL